jgi:prepilin peptidase CpaA
MADVITSLALVLVVALAVWQDLVEHQIPNILTGGALAAGLMAHSIFDGFNGCLAALAGAGVGLACLLPLYLGKGMGAGDVKLMGAVGAFLGPANAFFAAALALAAGAVLAAAFVVWRLAESRAVLQTGSAGQGPTAGASSAAISIIRKERFPYAVAIGFGAIATLWLTGTLDTLLRGLGLG